MLWLPTPVLPQVPASHVHNTGCAAGVEPDAAHCSPPSTQRGKNSLYPSLTPNPESGPAVGHQPQTTSPAGDDGAVATAGSTPHATAGNAWLSVPFLPLRACSELGVVLPATNAP